MSSDANRALRHALARNRAERRAAARLARRTAAAAARRVALARRLFGSTRISDVERIEALEPDQSALLDLLLEHATAPPAYPVPTTSIEVVAPLREHVRALIAAPRPGPAAGTALAAA